MCILWFLIIYLCSFTYASDCPTNNASLVCSGHGICITQPTTYCSCESEWGLDDCSLTCEITDTNTNEKCGGPDHGKCFRGKCLCKIGWEPPFCVDPYNIDCGSHGTLMTNPKYDENGDIVYFLPYCDCDEEWTGYNCTKTCPITYSDQCGGNDHGKCIHGECNCTIEYTGKECLLACPTHPEGGSVSCSYHGTCWYDPMAELPEGLCHCDKQYGGVACQWACLNECENRHICVCEPKIISYSCHCECLPGRYEPYCCKYGEIGEDCHLPPSHGLLSKTWLFGFVGISIIIIIIITVIGYIRRISRNSPLQYALEHHEKYRHLVDNSID